jgi:hypothetical protein
MGGDVMGEAVGLGVTELRELSTNGLAVGFYSLSGGSLWSHKIQLSSAALPARTPTPSGDLSPEDG